MLEENKVQLLLLLITTVTVSTAIHFNVAKNSEGWRRTRKIQTILFLLLSMRGTWSCDPPRALRSDKMLGDNLLMNDYCLNHANIAQVQLLVIYLGAMPFIMAQTYKWESLIHYLSAIFGLIAGDRSCTMAAFVILGTHFSYEWFNDNLKGRYLWPLPLEIMRAVILICISYRGLPGISLPSYLLYPKFIIYIAQVADAIALCFTKATTS